MGARGDARETVGDLVSLAELVRAGKNGMTAFISEHEDDQSKDECDVFGSAALQSAPPGGADQIFVDLHGERIIIGQRETRWQVAIEEGETVLRALGAGSPAYIKLKPDGTAEVIATSIKLGSESATSFVALANLVQAQLTALKSAIAAAPITPADGGAAFKAGLVAALASWPATTASTVVKSL